MPDTVIGSTLLMQPRNWATSVAVAHLALTKAGRRWTVTSRASGVVRTAGHAEDPKILAVTDAAHRATVEYVTRPIGTTPVAWRADSARVVDTPLMDFVLDVERKASGADLASASAFNLDAGLDSGAITVARLAAIYPYENTLRAVRISGAQLKAYLEWSARYYRTLGTPGSLIEPNVPGYNFDIVAGVDYTMDISRPAGERITSLTRNGRPVAPTDSFTLALNNYRQSGGGGYAMLRDAPVVYDRQQDIRQLLIDEVTQRKELRPADYYHHGNWTLAPGSAVAAAYRAMHRVAGQGEVTQPARPRTGAPRGATLSGPHLRIIGTNDFHGALEPRPDNTGHLRGGAAAVAGAIEAAERECAPPNCYSILLDGGDEFQGTPESNLAFGRPVTAVFNRLNLAASALGNHEFDWGVDTLRARIAQARYAILGANVRTTDGKPLPWLRADTIVERGPYRIGVIGLATVSTPTTTKASNTVGLRFEQPAPIVDSLAANLRTHGADFVVVIAHAGAFCGRGESATCDGEIITLAQQVTQKIDAIVSGHTHSLVNTVVRGIPIVQAQSSGQAIDVVDLPYDATPHEPLPPAVHQVRPVYTDSIAPDTAIARMVREASASIAPIVNRPVATIAEDMIRQGREYPLGDLIADAMRVEGKGDFGIMNNGGIRANLRAGQATYGSLFEVQPFGNLLYRVTARGADFRAYFEQLVARGAPNVHISGIVITYDPAREAGHRITSLLPTDGRAFSDTATYSIVMNDFMATGGDGLGFAHAAISSQPLDIVDLDALIAYLSAQPQPVHAPRGLRFVQEGAQ
jgi:2',3'-cyclic-nucleotide 2'-phosphodiesterase (5'-nucleotidase family)